MLPAMIKLQKLKPGHSNNNNNTSQLNFRTMKSLSNDIRMYPMPYASTEGKQQQSVQDHKGSTLNGHKKLQQLMEANAEWEAAIQKLEKEVLGLEAGNRSLDQQLENKREELEKAKEELESEEEKEENEGQQEMKAWITQVQNYSGVPQQVIDSLICLQYEGSAQDQEICLSCYQPMQLGAQCKYLPCCHLFHSECINNHLKVNKLCPACGEPVSH